MNPPQVSVRETLEDYFVLSDLARVLLPAGLVEWADFFSERSALVFRELLEPESKKENPR